MQFFLKIIVFLIYLQNSEASLVDNYSEKTSEKSDKIVLDKVELRTEHPLNEFFRLKKKNDLTAAATVLNNWKPSDSVENFYKEFFKIQILDKSNDSENKMWSLFLEIKKSKKLFRLQLEVLNNLFDIILDESIQKKDTINQNQLRSEAKQMLTKVKGLPEGLDLELKYLKWIVKNKISSELCKNERNRWLSQVNISLKEASEALKSCPMQYDDFIYRMRLLVFSGAEKQAQIELKEYIETNKMPDWKNNYLQAVFYTNIGDPVSAYEIVKKYEVEILNSDKYFDNLYYITQRAGELAKSEEIINKIIAKEKIPKLKNEFIYQKAFLFYQTKRYAEAIPIFNQLIKNQSTPNTRSHQFKRKRKSHLKQVVRSNVFDDLTWLRAWCYFLNKDYAMARVAFLENKEWTRDKARNIYWLAQSEWALDNKMKALEYFKQLAFPLFEGKYFNYYNYLAWIRFESNKNLISSDLLKNQLAVMKSGKGVFMVPDGDFDQKKLVDEYRSYFEDLNQTDEGEIQVVNQDAVVASQSDSEGINIESSAQLKKEVTWADHLLDWGYSDLAKWHLYDVEKSFKNRRSAETLIHYYLDKKFYYRALSLMQKFTVLQDKKVSLKDDELQWKSLYPHAYELNVKSEAALRKIDPKLIWSIMKAETQFKSDAISPVGAVGLMQFMPYTSQKVAQLLKESDHNPRVLFQPEYAIQHGAMYLRKLSREFDNQLPLIAAAYNGGPHRVKLWLRNLGDIDFDVFVEHIPFGETRTYVKRVLSYMTTYQKIYEEKPDYKKSQWMIEKNQYKLSFPISLKEEWDFPIQGNATTSSK